MDVLRELPRSPSKLTLTTQQIEMWMPDRDMGEKRDVLGRDNSLTGGGWSSRSTSAAAAD